MKAITEFVDKRGIGRVYLGDSLSHQSDIVFIANNDEVEGSPELAIEVVVNTSRAEHRQRLRNYSESGIKECWLVYPDSALVEVHGWRDNNFQVLGRYFEGEVVKSEVLAGLELATDTLFEE